MLKFERSMNTFGTNLGPTYDTCVLFGGNGFIGTHLAAHLLETGRVANIVLADSVPASPHDWPDLLKKFHGQNRVKYVELDVRQTVSHPGLPARADLIVNLAAVHREPGHQRHEYFDTNIPGAKNVCQWASQAGCRRIIFTSSIAVYGAPEGSEKDAEAKTEQSVPAPTTPYGESKLEAERIHQEWQAADPNRSLLVVRPGVIFGPGERGNITHMIHAVLKGYFFYVGNRATRKAGGYVKELCSAVTFMMDGQDKSGKKYSLFNFTMDPAPSVEDYVNAIRHVAGIRRAVLGAPYPLLLAGSYLVNAFGKLTGTKQPINPVRVRKLRRSNNIVPGALRASGYHYQYTLEQALADWRASRREDWV